MASSGIKKKKQPGKGKERRSRKAPRKEESLEKSSATYPGEKTMLKRKRHVGTETPDRCMETALGTRKKKGKRPRRPFGRGQQIRLAPKRTRFEQKGKRRLRPRLKTPARCAKTPKVPWRKNCPAQKSFERLKLSRWGSDAPRKGEKELSLANRLGKRAKKFRPNNARVRDWS